MRIAEIIFTGAVWIVAFAYLGYPLLTGALALVKKNGFQKNGKPVQDEDLPAISVVVPCYNEAGILQQKIENCLSADYPVHKISFLFITDGTTDQSSRILAQYPAITHIHKEKRAGKAAAINRAMQFVPSGIVFFSDANSMVNKEAFRRMAVHFSDPETGCVSGEKKVLLQHSENASAAGEGIYWKYESFVKKMDAACNTSVGAIGELMAIRRSLFQPLSENTILDDFILSMQIAAAGYRIVYEPRAIASEEASLNMEEELKRKTRIATGNWQALYHLSGKIKISHTPFLFFQYIIQRWVKRAISPFLLLFIFGLNAVLVQAGNNCYAILLYVQLFFYIVAAAGYLLRNRKTKLGLLFAPYYFCTINYAAIAGLIRLLRGTDSGIWEKAARRNG